MGCKAAKAKSCTGSIPVNLTPYQQGSSNRWFPHATTQQLTGRCNLRWLLVLHWSSLTCLSHGLDWCPASNRKVWMANACSNVVSSGHNHTMPWYYYRSCYLIVPGYTASWDEGFRCNTGYGPVLHAAWSSRVVGGLCDVLGPKGVLGSNSNKGAWDWLYAEAASINTSSPYVRQYGQINLLIDYETE